MAALIAGPATGSASAAPPCPNEGTAGTLLDAATFERAVVCLVNRQRTGHNRRPVRPNPKLTRAASRYATQMVLDGFFAHRPPDGNSSILSRLEAVGYLEDALEWQIGENLSWGTGATSTPTAIVQGWMLSPYHRENMLRPTFREVGIGVALGTPFAPADVSGITVASEYGARAGRRPRDDGKGGNPKDEEQGKPTGHPNGPKK
jgi:uncharacterized protein YkwD